jgi:DNA-binding response OmpR family regulator
MEDPRASPGPARVLVAEDEPHIRRILVTLLEAAGYVPDAVEDGLDAIARLRGPTEYAAVVLDLFMPGASGLEVLEEVQGMAHRDGTPVLILTAKGQDADRDRAFELGAAGFTTKPFSPKKLLGQIDDLLSDS